MNWNKIVTTTLVLGLLAFSCTIKKAEGQQKITAPELTEPNRHFKCHRTGKVGIHPTAGRVQDQCLGCRCPQARSLARTDEGIVFVGNRGKHNVYALIDANADGKADYRYTIAEGLNDPNGVAFKDGNLYVAEINRILVFPDIVNHLTNPTYKVVFDGYPDKGHHGQKFIAFGPDGYLYVPVGAPCNICNPDEEIFASITRIDVNSKNIKPEFVAHGVRNSVGFDWDPVSKKMWFTDNNRDNMGDDLPSGELNEVTVMGQHFGYPFWHAGDVKDPEFGDKGKDKSAYVAPRVKLGPDVALARHAVLYRRHVP